MPTGADQRFAAIERRLDNLEAELRRRMNVVENGTAENLATMAADIEAMRPEEPDVPAKQ